LQTNADQFDVSSVVSFILAVIKAVYKHIISHMCIATALQLSTYVPKSYRPCDSAYRLSAYL